MEWLWCRWNEAESSFTSIQETRLIAIVKSALTSRVLSRGFARLMITELLKCPVRWEFFAAVYVHLQTFTDKCSWDELCIGNVTKTIAYLADCRYWFRHASCFWSRCLLWKKLHLNVITTIYIYHCWKHHKVFKHKWCVMSCNTFLY